jgi:hypothetical protein
MISRTEIEAFGVQIARVDTMREEYNSRVGHLSLSQGGRGRARMYSLSRSP